MTTTLRLADDLAAAVRRASEEENISFNQLCVEAIQRYVEARKAEEWRRGFEAMASDPEAFDVDYAFAAQAEIVLADE